MENFKEKGGKTSLNCGTIELLSSKERLLWKKDQLKLDQITDRLRMQ